jgi:hypothetical protein
MTRLALSEEKYGKENFDVGRFYQSDYIRYSLLKTLFSVTVGYGLILGMVALYHAEYLIANAVTLNYKQIGGYVLLFYLLLLLVYSGITLVVSSIKYARATRFERKYGKVLRILERAYKEEEEGKQEDI